MLSYKIAFNSNFDKYLFSLRRIFLFIFGVLIIIMIMNEFSIFKDSVTITVDAVCYFRVSNPVVSVTNVENAQYSTRLLAATTLRNILGTRTLQEILQDKEVIAHHMQEILDEATEHWYN